MRIIKVGDKFNHLTAIGFSHKIRTNQFWLFKCDCGNEKVIKVCNVKAGHTKSCGCLKKTHGMCETRVYKCWTAMKGRCLNKKNIGYKNYGNRGIKICKEWMIFDNFYRDMGEMPKKKSLDRIDNNSGYCKDNCRWATQKEQMNNTRYNRFLTYNGKTQTIAQWARELDIKYYNIQYRIRANYSIKRILDL